VWVTGAHVLLFEQYLARHAKEAAMMTSMPMPTHPRLMMTLMGPVIGLVSGIVLGIFAAVATRLVRPAGVAATSGTSRA
jgi:hypothetical protein